MQRVARRRSLVRVLPPVLMLAVLLALVAQQHGLILRSSSWAEVGPWPVSAPASATVDLGVTTLPLARNPSRPWQPSDLGTVNVFEHEIRLHVSVIMWYADWAHGPPSLSQLNAVERRGSVPEITWEPWNASGRLFDAQPKYALRNIASGRFDTYIRAWALRLAAWGKPVRLRFAQEMNGDWYPWGHEINGNRPIDFVRAWRRVHRIFAHAGARNVVWVWSPVSGAPRAYFPGRQEVNMLGVTCLNGGSTLFQHRWQTFLVACGRSTTALHRLDPHLPIELSEVGSSTAGGSKTVWIDDMFAFLARHPAIKSLIWFNVRKEADWRLDTSAAPLAAFRRGTASGRYR